MNIIKIFTISLLSLVTVSCSAQKEKTSAEAVSAKKSVSKTKLEKIELNELTRGSTRTVVITPTAKKIDRNGNVTTVKTTAAEWEKMVKLASAVDLKSIGSHKSPTTQRFYDGAMAATLKVTSGGITYESQGFDSGIPPKAFSELYFATASSFDSKK